MSSLSPSSPTRALQADQEAAYSVAQIFTADLLISSLIPSVDALAVQAYQMLRPVGHVFHREPIAIHQCNDSRSRALQAPFDGLLPIRLFTVSNR